jgi:hypothetical protein
MCVIVAVRFVHNPGSDMARRRTVVRLGLPALIVAGLAAVALWRIGGPAADPSAVGTSGTASRPGRPLTQIADLVVENVTGRQATLEGVPVLQVTSPRTFWIGEGDESAFVVLDPDVKRGPDVRIAPGQRVTLVGLVRPAPPVSDAMRQWAIDAATAESLQERGTYLHAIEIR